MCLWPKKIVGAQGETFELIYETTNLFCTRFLMSEFMRWRANRCSAPRRSRPFFSLFCVFTRKADFQESCTCTALQSVQTAQPSHCKCAAFSPFAHTIHTSFHRVRARHAVQSAVAALPTYRALPGTHSLLFRLSKSACLYCCATSPFSRLF